MKDLLSWIYTKLKTIAYLLYHSEVAYDISHFLRAFLTNRNTKLAFRVAIIYTALCLLFELTKQFFIWRHENYLVKNAVQNKKMHEKRRIMLRDKLELAVVKGNEAEIESIRK